jgi:hypothetical protein
MSFAIVACDSVGTAVGLDGGAPDSAGTPDGAGTPDTAVRDGGTPDDAAGDAQTRTDGASPDGSDDDSGASDAGLQTTGPFSISVSSGKLVPAFSPDVHDYELSAFTTLVPVRLTLSGRSGAVDGKAVAPDVSYVLPNPSITSTARISVSVLGDGAGTYVIHLAPADLPGYAVTIDSPGGGHIFLTPRVNSGSLAPYLLVVGTNGVVEYYQRLDIQATDFKKQILTNGATRYTYISGFRAHVMDENFQPIDTYNLLATATHPDLCVDNHDFLLLEDNHYIGMCYVPELVQNIPSTLPHPAGGALVYSALVQEVKNHAVTFEWESTQHPELYELSTEQNDYTSTEYRDYAHINALEIDPSDGDLVLSLRHLDAILKIRKVDGSTAWRLGGPNDSFGTIPAQRTSHQHFARFLPDGRLQVFDNGNATKSTRVVIYGLNQQAHTIESFVSFPLNTYSNAQGSVQSVSGGLFIGLGSRAATAPDVLKFDPTTGHRSFELTFMSQYHSYRAQFFP